MIRNRKRVRKVYRNRIDNRCNTTEKELIKLFKQILKNQIENYSSNYDDNLSPELESYKNMIMRVLKVDNPTYECRLRCYRILRKFNAKVKTY